MLDKLHQWLRLRLLKCGDKILVGCIYRSPSSSRDNFNHLVELLRKISSSRYSHLLLMGDFNLREIDWNNCTTTVGEDHVATIFLECIRDGFLTQHVKEPTRIRDNNEPSVLDLIITNEENMIGNIEYKPGLGKSDHLGLLFVFNCYTEFIKAQAFKKLNFFKGDYQSINTALQQRDWTKELLGLNLTQSWSYLAEIIIQLIEKFIPVSKARDEGSKNNPYVNRSCLDAIRNKHRKWLKYKYCMSQDNYDKYKNSRNTVTSELRKAKYMYEKDLTAKIKTDNKLFWGYVRSKTKTKTAVSNLTNSLGGLSKNDQETADILNDFFASVFELEGDGPIPDFDERQYNQELNHILITEEHIEKAINKLKQSKSQGPDNIHPKFLKESQFSIKRPLQIIFQNPLMRAFYLKCGKKPMLHPFLKRVTKKGLRITDL